MAVQGDAVKLSYGLVFIAAAEIDRGFAIERLTDRPDGVEQSWRLAKRPAGHEDLVVQVSLTGQKFTVETAMGLHFLDAAAGVGVRYGLATFIDANDHRTTLH